MGPSRCRLPERALVLSFLPPRCQQLPTSHLTRCAHHHIAVDSNAAAWQQHILKVLHFVMNGPSSPQCSSRRSWSCGAASLAGLSDWRWKAVCRWGGTCTAAAQRVGRHVSVARKEFYSFRLVSVTACGARENSEPCRSTPAQKGSRSLAILCLPLAFPNFCDHGGSFAQMHASSLELEQSSPR